MLCFTVIFNVLVVYCWRVGFVYNCVDKWWRAWCDCVVGKSVDKYFMVGFNVIVLYFIV